MRRWRESVLLVGMITWACTGPNVIVPGGAAQGDPIDPGVKPDAAACAAILRADTRAAKAIRAEYRIDGLPATDVAVAAAANDPTADVSVLGIPLSGREIDAVERSGMALDERSALTGWVHVGATDRFGGVWIDPPGSDQYVVSIVGSDPSALALARCVEPARVRYVHATQSLADGLALQMQITNDWQALRRSGIDINSTGYSEIEGIVEVGVTTLTDEIVALIRERYGDRVRVVEAGPAVPD